MTGFDVGDYYKPQKAVLIAPSRSGSTWLCHCLDSHYGISCERDEPFSPHRSFSRLGLYHTEIMNALWERGGYKVTMFKVTYRQLEKIGIETFKHNKAKIIHLWRNNALRVIVSSAINTEAANGRRLYPLHSFDDTLTAEVLINPYNIKDEIESYLRKIKNINTSLLKVDYLPLVYEVAIGKDGEIDQYINLMICKFLGVDNQKMISQTKRMNPEPLNEIIINYHEIERALKNTPYEWMLHG